MTSPAHPGRMLFVNMPVADVARSKAFFAKLGFSYNPMFTDETAACMLVGEQAFVMLLSHEKFAEFAKLPMADPATHTVEIRFDLPTALQGAKPGMFARVWLPTSAAGEGRLYVPKRALIRRAELDGVYVIGGDGKPNLRQVRVGQTAGANVEVLAGLTAGERVALDPQAAARIR